MTFSNFSSNCQSLLHALQDLWKFVSSTHNLISPLPPTANSTPPPSGPVGPYLTPFPLFLGAYADHISKQASNFLFCMQVRTGPFEEGDILAVANAVPAMAACMWGFFTPGMVGGMVFCGGLGVTLFGISYMFIHDGLVHRRFPVCPAPPSQCFKLQWLWSQTRL
jgi:hypothetical protein